jgi:hypothetical protein
LRDNSAKPGKWSGSSNGMSAQQATAAVEDMVREELRRAPDRTLAELKAKVREHQGSRIERNAVVAGLAANGAATEKKFLHAAEQDTEAGRRQRQEWWNTIAALAPETLIFLDESGITTEMSRAYGRAPRGERVREGIPAGHRRTLSILSALTTAGLLATMTICSRLNLI